MTSKVYSYCYTGGTSGRQFTHTERRIDLLFLRWVYWSLAETLQTGRILVCLQYQYR